MRLRVKDEKKFRRFLLISLVFFVILFYFISSVLDYRPVRGEREITTEEIIVKNGDSLWSIASNINKSNKDIRKIVYNIKKLNKLESDTLFPGRQLTVPIESE